MEDRKIRLCFVLTTVFPLFVPVEHAIYGGAELNFFFLAQAFSRDPRFEVLFLVGDYGQEDVLDRDGIRLVKIRHMNHDTHFMVHSERYRQSVGTLLQREINLYRTLRSANADVYLTTCGGGMLGRLVFVACTMMHRKCVFRMAHDYDADPAWLREQRHAVLFRLYRYGLRRASRIVAQTQAQHDALLGNTGLESRIVGNGIQVGPRHALVPRSHVLWVGRADTVKRPERFLALAERMPDHRFVMIMNGENALKESIAARAASIGNLELIDFVPIGEIDRYFEAAIAYVNTSEAEGFPNTFIQACAAGTPILTFKANPDDVLGRYGIGCCCGDDLDAAAAFVRSLDAGTMERYRDHMTRYLQERHSLDNTVSQYRDIILGVLA